MAKNWGISNGQSHQFIERFRQWAYDLRDIFQELSSEEDYRYWFDPYWLRAEPYRLSLRSGEGKEIVLHLQNFRKGKQTHRIEVHTLPGIIAEPAVLEGSLKAQQRGRFPVRIKIIADAAPGVSIVAFDTTLDGKKYGQRFDLIVEKKP